MYNKFKELLESVDSTELLIFTFYKMLQIYLQCFGSECLNISIAYCGTQIIHTKICENFVRIKQNVWIILKSKSMEKHAIVRIKQNVRIIHVSHYLGSTVFGTFKKII